MSKSASDDAVFILAAEIGQHTAHYGWSGRTWWVECLNTACGFSELGDEGGLTRATAAFNRHVAACLLKAGYAIPPAETGGAR